MLILFCVAYKLKQKRIQQQRNINEGIELTTETSDNNIINVKTNDLHRVASTSMHINDSSVLYHITPMTHCAPDGKLIKFLLFFRNKWRL